MGDVFDLENLNPGAWFTMEGGGRVKIRSCAGDDFRAIRKQTTKTKVEFRNNQRYTYDEVNEDLQSELLWDFCIVGWENLFDARGNPIPCTKENKLLLMGRSLAFSNFVGSAIKTMTDKEGAVREEEEKN